MSYPAQAERAKTLTARRNTARHLSHYRLISAAATIRREERM
jgi:hypothetical protein